MHQYGKRKRGKFKEMFIKCNHLLETNAAVLPLFGWSAQAFYQSLPVSLACLCKPNWR